jgi:hypothetical protein
MIILLGVPHEGWFISLDMPRDDGHSLRYAQERMIILLGVCKGGFGHSFGRAPGRMAIPLGMPEAWRIVKLNMTET